MESKPLLLNQKLVFKRNELSVHVMKRNLKTDALEDIAHIAQAVSLFIASYEVIEYLLQKVVLTNIFQ